SARRTARLARPEGNAVETAATLTPVPASASTATGTRSLYTHTAAAEGQVGSAGSGRTAFAASARTFPGVSAPSSVVRSTMRMIVSSAQAFEVVLIDRVLSAAARPSAPTLSTPGSPWR